MGKLSNTTTATAKPGAKSALKAKKSGKTVPTNEGGVGFKATDKTALFLLATTSFFGEGSFYEDANEKAKRLISLTHKVTKSDPQWVEEFAAWLRGPGNIRTAALVIAAEYIVAGGPNGRKIINSVCQRADEPAEILAYWSVNHYGKKGKGFTLASPKLPQSLRKGLADSAMRLYNEYSTLKYNSPSRGVAMANVLNLVHPKAEDDAQKQLFQYIIDRAYDNDIKLELLPMITKAHEMRNLPLYERRAHLNPEELKAAGMTWEAVSGWLSGPMDADAWESLIPTMGYMALLRNLRNFNDAKISTKSRNAVIKTLSDPEKVAKSRQLPFRFWSAYKNTHSENYKLAISDGLDLSTLNIPGLTGSTDIYVDLSGSMGQMLSDKGSINMWEAGALFGSALWRRSMDVGGDVRVIGFASQSKVITLNKSQSVLSAVAEVGKTVNRIGHGTELGRAISDHSGRKQPDRIVVFSDMQIADYMPDVKSVDFVHCFNLAGYRQQTVDTNKNGYFIYGGLTDSTFSMMNNLENGLGSSWPWED